MVDRTYVMTNGTMRVLTAIDKLESTEELIAAYLGSSREPST